MAVVRLPVVSAEANNQSSSTSIFNQAVAGARSATTAIRCFGVNGYQSVRALFLAEVDAADVGIIAPAAMGVVLGGLFQYANVKSQGKTGFPFDTNPISARVSLYSLLTYSLAYVAERLFINSGFDPTSVCVRIARLVMIGCVYTVIASLAHSLYN